MFGGLLRGTESASGRIQCEMQSIFSAGEDEVTC